VEELASALTKKNIDICVFAINKFAEGNISKSNPLRNQFKKKLSRYLHAVSAILSNLGNFKREFRIVTTEKPDIVLVRYNIFNFSMPIICRLKKIPCILEVNAPMAYERRRFSPKGQWNFYIIAQIIEWLNLKLASRVFVVSNDLKRFYENIGIQSKKIQVIPNGANTKVFNFSITGSHIRQNFNIEDKIVLGFIGSFHFWHGMDNLKHIVQMLCSRYPQEICFLLVGNGPLKKNFEKDVKEQTLNKQVIFTDYIPHQDVAKYIAAMDIALAPYPEMDFFYFSPLKIFEYMALGKVVVAPNIGQITEIIENGINGLTYAVDSQEEMIDTIEKAIDDEELRRKIGQQAFQTIKEKYTWQHSVSRLTKIMEEMKSD